LKIIKTENAGTSWIDISPYQSGQSLNSVWFQDEINGLFIGSTIKNDGGEYYPIQSVILKTRDGGQIWEEVVIPDFIEMYDLQHINDSTAYFLAKKGTSYEAEYLLCKTIDNLNTWTIVYQHVFHESSNINSFYCLDDMTLFAIMTDSSLTRSLMKSIDGGTTWVKQLANGWDGDDGEIYFKNDNIGIIAAGNFPYQTFDGGNNWTFQNFWYDLFGVHFIDENKGFAFGGGAGDHAIWGDLFITGNGGNTWSKAPNQPPTIIISCIFVDQMTGFILSRDGSYHCSKSIDGGQSWSELNKFNANFDTGYYIHSCNDIYFLDETNGWAVGRFGWTNESTLDLSGAGILGTYDGGENWDLVWTYPNPYNALTSIHAVNSTAWAVGENGMIVKYTIQDQWQLQSANTDLPLNSVFFCDEKNGWISGGYLNNQGFKSILLKTTDGGEVWKKNWFEKYLINDIYFTDSMHGWAVGNDTTDTQNWPPGQGAILYSSDGGDNWTPQIEGFSAALTAIQFKDGYGWVVGSNGIVLRTENGTTWLDQKLSNITSPEEFSLKQNYPNPFNPKTIFKYNLLISSEVDLNIYNLLGQEVATLVSEKQPAGNYKVNWDASGFASGVYLYRLQTDQGFMKTRKLVVLK